MTAQKVEIREKKGMYRETGSLISSSGYLLCTGAMHSGRVKGYKIPTVYLLRPEMYTHTFDSRCVKCLYVLQKC